MSPISFAPAMRYFAPQQTVTQNVQRTQAIQHVTFGQSKPNQNVLLFVDDDPAQKAIFGAILAPNLKNTQIKYATNAQSALNIIKQGGITHLLTDVNMGNPTQTGFWLVEQVNQMNKALQPSNILINSDKKDKTYQQRASKLGAAFIQKPMDVNDYQNEYPQLLNIQLN